jgi:hypothetical protein
MRQYAVAFTLCVALGSMTAVTGCGSSGSAPTPVPSTVKVPTLVPVQLSGVVADDDGAPASGVTVFAYAYDGPNSNGKGVTTVTDGSGNYSITFNSTGLTPGGDLFGPVRAEKSGYESSAYDGPIGCLLRDPSTNACRSGATFAANLQIYRIRYVPVGQSLTIDVKRGNSQCAIPNDDVPPLCRAVRFTGPPGATVAVQASTNVSMVTGATLALDPNSLTCCSLAVTATMPASGELSVYAEMSGYLSGPYSFTLTSAILP